MKLIKYRVLQYLPGRLGKRYQWKYQRERLLELGGREKVFSEIYEQNYWESEESRSGPGSELEYTENLRQELPKLLKV